MYMVNKSLKGTEYKLKLIDKKILENKLKEVKTLIDSDG